MHIVIYCHILATHVAENIPHGVAHRVFSNCSENSDYVEAKAEFSAYLENRFYNKEWVASKFEKVEKLNKESQISFQKNDHFLGLKLGLGP